MVKKIKVILHHESPSFHLVPVEYFVDSNCSHHIHVAVVACLPSSHIDDHFLVC